MFTLHERLAADSLQVGELPLCLLLLMNDANYPWFVLVPKREEKREIYQLDMADRAQLLIESCTLSEVMESLFRPTKMNVAALGNMVPQLHIHHIARFTGDAAWPNPIWGAVPPIAYDKARYAEIVEGIKRGFDQSEVRLEV